jgi:DNA-directed RNA polymerase specialized sigma24 family protein
MAPKPLGIDLNEIIKYYNDGLSSIEIGRMFNCSDAYIRNKLKNAGTALRGTMEKSIAWKHGKY